MVSPNRQNELIRTATYNVEVLIGIERPRIRQTAEWCVMVDLRLEGGMVVVAEDIHEIQVSEFFGKVSQR
jgi:hypothetical protein